MESVSSSTNIKFKLWKSLLTSKGIKKEKLFILSGEKLIREFLSADQKSHSYKFELVAELKTKELESIIVNSSKNLNVPVYELAKELFNELDEVGTHFNLLIIKTPELKTWSSEVPCLGLEVISPLGDPQNLGALIRSAVSFSCDKLILSSESANPFLPKSIKASSGSIFYAPLYTSGSINNLSDDESKFDFKNTYILDKSGDSIYDISFNKNTRLLVGEEGPGFKNFPNLSKLKKISIPIRSTESLNAFVATTLTMYQYRSKYKLDLTNL